MVREIVSKYKQEDNDDEFFQSQNENNQRFNSYLPSCDEYVSTILDTLKESGIYDNTIVIFFTDHGTSIGEKKGEKFYGVYTYDYTIGVFSILHIPGIEAKTVNEQCRTLDLFPTIAELAGIPLGKDFDELQGKSLLELIENPSNEEREVFVETGGLYGPWPSARKHNVFCIRSNQKKLIYNDTPKTWELYDLEKDPMEINNIYEENLLIVQDLKKRLIWNLNDNNIVTKIS